MIYKRGKQGTYWFRFRFAGRIVHESARTQSKTVAKEAEKQRHRRLEEQFNGIEKRKLPPTVSQAAEEWLRKRAALEDSTRETYAFALAHVKAHFGKRLICDIDAPDVAAYQRARIAEDAAPATVNKELVCLASILADHRLWDRIRRDVKRLEENESAGRAIESAEERRLLEAASTVGTNQGWWSPIYAVTVLGLNTGLRHAEVRNLRWRDVDLERRVLIVGKTKTEAGTGRPVPLTQPAWAALSLWASRFAERRSDDFVFPACENGRVDSGQPIHNWRTAWNRACRIAGLAGLRYHDLRHSAATKMLESGVPLATVAQVLGWSASTAVRMAKRYGHIRPDAQRAALERIATPDFGLAVHQIGNQVPSVQ